MRYIQNFLKMGLPWLPPRTMALGRERYAKNLRQRISARTLFEVSTQHVLRFIVAVLTPATSSR